MPDVLLPVAASVTDQIGRWFPVVLAAGAAGVLWLRRRDRRRGEGEDDDAETP